MIDLKSALEMIGATGTAKMFSLASLRAFFEEGYQVRDIRPIGAKKEGIHPLCAEEVFELRRPFFREFSEPPPHGRLARVEFD